MENVKKWLLINVSNDKLSLSSNALKFEFLFKSESSRPAETNVNRIQTVALKKSLTAKEFILFFI